MFSVQTRVTDLGRFLDDSIRNKNPARSLFGWKFAYCREYMFINSRSCASNREFCIWTLENTCARKIRPFGGLERLPILRRDAGGERPLCEGKRRKDAGGLNRRTRRVGQRTMGHRVFERSECKREVTLDQGLPKSTPRRLIWNRRWPQIIWHWFRKKWSQPDKYGLVILNLYHRFPGWETMRYGASDSGHNHPYERVFLLRALCTVTGWPPSRQHSTGWFREDWHHLHPSFPWIAETADGLVVVYRVAIRIGHLQLCTIKMGSKRIGTR